MRNFLFSYYTEKKTASEVTIDKAQSLFWRADLVNRPRYSTHFSMDSRVFCWPTFKLWFQQGREEKQFQLFNFVYSTRLSKGVSRQLDIYSLTAHYVNNNPIVFENYCNCLASNPCFSSQTIFSSYLWRHDTDSSQDSVAPDSRRTNQKCPRMKSLEIFWWSYGGFLWSKDWGDGVGEREVNMTQTSTRTVVRVRGGSQAGPSRGGGHGRDERSFHQPRNVATGITPLPLLAGWLRCP